MTQVAGTGASRLDELAQGFRGELLRPDKPGYDSGRQIWNAMFDRRPDVVLMCEGAADVIDAVSYARANGLPLAVYGGGHGIAGNASIDGGMMLNLSRMDGVRIDRRAGTVRVEGGATWGDVDRETQAFGMAVPGGVVADTGVAGLTLGGGIGWLRNKCGLSCDNLVSADVVTADGELLTASADEHPDLFWAIRGGGGNFGVVTSFEFRMHPVGPTVAAAIPFYAAEDAPGILRGWRDFVATAPEGVSSAAVFWTIPADPPGMPPDVVGRPVLVTAGAYAGPVDEGEQVLRPLRELGTPIADISGTLPYRALQSAFDPYLGSKGKTRAYWKSLYFSELSDGALETIASSALERPTPWTMVNLLHFGGAVTRVAPDATAFGQRWPFWVSIDANAVDDSVPDADLKSWTRSTWDQLQPLSAGGLYLNFLGQEEAGGDEAVKLAYGANYDRLRELKRRYDPDNFFHLNQNIVP